LPWKVSFAIITPMREQHPIEFAICNEVFQGWSLDKTFRFAAATGYDAVEISPFTLAETVADISALQRKAIRENAAQAGIQISGIHWILVKPAGLYINHPDHSIRERTRDYFCELVDFCADIGGSFMVVGSPKQRNVMDGVSYEQAWQWALDTFREPVARAEKRGVTICLEPLSPMETNFINTAAEAVRFIQQFKSPNFKIILDVKAMSSEAKAITQIIQESADYVGYFHANDPNLKGPGFGQVAFKPIAGALAAVGYKGFVSVEVFNFDEGPETIATKSLACLKTAFGR
jgi:sugar phosphate isomerase/epimerase